MIDFHQILTNTITVAALLLFVSATIRFGVYIDRMRARVAGPDARSGVPNVHDRLSFARLGP